MLLLALLLLLTARPVHAESQIGFQLVQVPDPQGTPIEVGIWYPTATPATRPVPGLGDTLLAPNSPLLGKDLPLVVMSHGNGGWFGGHHDTAETLARAGFVVAALTHTHDNFRDQSRSTDLASRPRQLHVLIDYMLADWPQHGQLDPGRVGAFGFSAGGLTVLAAAGGELDLTRVPAHCSYHPTHFDCRLMTLQPPPADALAAPWIHDARIRAAVAAAPALGYAFTAKSLASITLPVQLWRAENDEILVDPFHATAILHALPVKPDYRVVQGAGHYDFLTPCPPGMARELPHLCTSAPGFDRAAFHLSFNRAVAAFFTANLPPKQP
ncbi:dienelactone hydrolase [Caulobacter henricii]|uniref:Dienelactone hydrolase n=1 Tax=Caulobacter henricii TaxID=69395 RepID=A0A0P0P4E2_9CAUL|nr:dienelactone hydrolase [Caulobacter henricii]